MKGTKVAPALLGMLLLTGCASAQVDKTRAQGQGSTAVDVSVLRQAYSGLDYPTYPSPMALAKEADIVATAVVRTFSDGHAWLSERGHGMSNVRHRYAVMQIDLSNVRKGRNYTFDGQAYVLLYRGSENVNEAGEVVPQPSGAPSTVVTLQKLRTGIPAGTRVAILGSAKTVLDAQAEENLSGAEKGRPKGAQLVEPHAEGLIFDGGAAQGAVGGIVEIPSEWFQSEGPGAVTFDDLEKRLMS